jgi:hypothetical protein
MRNLLKTVAAVAVAAGALLGAKSAAAAVGVVMVHGTSNHTNATADYWTSDTANKIANGKKSLVVSYQGSACSGIGSTRMGGADEIYNCNSWSAIADQVNGWLDANPDVTDIAVVSHSNGAAPVRYMLAHPTANARVQRFVGLVRKTIFIAASNNGTELADKVTTSGTLANIANSILSFFGGGSYNTPAVWAQRRDRMSVYNSQTNGAYNTAAYPCGQGMTTCGGKPSQYVRGTSVYAAIWSGDAWCGGYLTTVGLQPPRSTRGAAAAPTASSPVTAPRTTAPS